MDEISSQLITQAIMQGVKEDKNTEVVLKVTMAQAHTMMIALHKWAEELNAQADPNPVTAYIVGHTGVVLSNLLASKLEEMPKSIKALLAFLIIEHAPSDVPEWPDFIKEK